MSLVRFLEQNAEVRREISLGVDDKERVSFVTIVEAPVKDSVNMYTAVARFSPDTEAVFALVNDSTAKGNGRSGGSTKDGKPLPLGARVMTPDETARLMAFGRQLWSLRCPSTPTQQQTYRRSG